MSTIAERLRQKHPMYFEAILQLRDASPEAVALVRKELEREGLPIVKEVRYPNGFDYYLGDQKFTRKLGKILQQQFGGEFLVTSSLYSRKEGKDIYRFTVLFRGIPFQKGKKIIYRGEAHLVLALGKDILLQNLLSKKKIHLKWKDLKEIKKSD